MPGSFLDKAVSWLQSDTKDTNTRGQIGHLICFGQTQDTRALVEQALARNVCLVFQYIRDYLVD